VDKNVELSVRLASLAIAYFVANTLPVATVIALTEAKSLPATWHNSYRWSLPYYFVAAAMAGLFSAARQHVGWQTAMLILPVTYLIYRSATTHMRRLEEEKQHAEEMSAAHLRTIESLAMAIEAKDQTTHDHLQRVQIYAMEVGKELKLGKSELEAVRAASVLHDIGKIAVPEHIISKPGKLTPEEFHKMKIHPVVGAQIVQRAQFPFPVAPIVKHHHEKWDGSGYPDGLKGEEIPIGARIIAAVDCLDALASDRQYRRALPLDKAMEVVVMEAGKAFDPKVVEVLRRRYVELEKIARQHPAEAEPLATDINIERGAAPAAGFEDSGHSDTEAGKGVVLPASIAEQLQILGSGVPHNGSVSDLDTLFLRLPGIIAGLAPWQTLAVYLRCEDTLVPAYVTGKESQLFSSLRIPLGQGLSGWVAENRKPIINGNPSVEPNYLNDPGKRSNLQSGLAIPLEGALSVVGVLALYHTDANTFTRNHLNSLLVIGSSLAPVIERHIVQRQRTEPLTLATA
jgi:putative nucleotidyltransferase with HDIG domain